MAQVRSASLPRATRTSSISATSILDVFDLRFLRANGLRRRGQLKGADRRHAQDTIDEGSDPRPEGILHGLELKFLFSHSAVEETRDNGVFVGPQLRKNFRHVEPRLEAGDPRGPKIFRRNGVLLGLLCPKHRFPKALGITRRGRGAKGGQPAFHIHLTGREAGPIILYLNHSSSLVSACLGAGGGAGNVNRAMDSTWFVWGNMSMMPLASSV